MRSISVFLLVLGLTAPARADGTRGITGTWTGQMFGRVKVASLIHLGRGMPNAHLFTLDIDRQGQQLQVSLKALDSHPPFTHPVAQPVGKILFESPDGRTIKARFEDAQHEEAVSRGIKSVMGPSWAKTLVSIWSGGTDVTFRLRADDSLQIDAKTKVRRGLTLGKRALLFDLLVRRVVKGVGQGVFQRE